MFPKEFTKFVLNPYIKENKGTVSLYIITTVIIFILMTMVLPILYTFFSVNVNTLASRGNLVTLKSVPSFFFIFSILIILFVIFEKIRNSTEYKINIDFVNHFRKRLINKLVLKYKHNFEEPNVGVLIPRIISLSQDSLRYVEYVIRINQYLLALILISGTSFYFSKTIGVIFLVYVILYIVMTYYRFMGPLKKI